MATANMVPNMIVPQHIEDNTTVQSKTAVEGKSQNVCTGGCMGGTGTSSTWTDQQADGHIVSTDQTQIKSLDCY